MLKYIIALVFSTSTFMSQALPNENGWRPAWGLDRIDQRYWALDDTYNYTLTGAGVNVYVFDSGINSSHEEFSGRVKPGFNVINDAYGTEDCAGHGSHTASLIGGKTYGVAKEVNLIPVRVLNCNNGNPSSATLYSAMDWIRAHHDNSVPSIVNMSVGMSRSEAFNEAVRSLIADGLIVVAAAGNNNRDACLYSPGSEISAITVGGIDRADTRASYSNYGACVDIFAPGSDLVGAWAGATNTYRSSSGTSNAAPIVTGIIATLLQANPNLTQEQAQQEILKNATRDAIYNVGSASPNLLAYSVIDDVALPSPTTTTTIPSTTTTTVPGSGMPTTTTLPPSVKLQTGTTIPQELLCNQPAQRSRLYGVPYVCVNTGHQLVWVPQRYSPGRP